MKIIKQTVKKKQNMPTEKKVNKAYNEVAQKAYKKGGSTKFPDLTGDGKVTRADVLKGRGVFKAGGSKNWIKGAIKRPGAFSAKAEAADMSTAAYAAKVTKPGSTASTTTKRQANLAKTLSKMRKKK